MVVRLANPVRRRRTSVHILTLSMICGLSASSVASDLRDCIAKATNAAAVASCEQRGQVKSKEDILHLSAAIRTRLNNSQRLVFERSVKAWEAFLEHESAFLKLSLSLRGDGLGQKLEQGGVSRLYEQREQQLREHLHNLSITDSGR